MQSDSLANARGSAASDDARNIRAGVVENSACALDCRSMTVAAGPSMVEIGSRADPGLDWACAGPPKCSASPTACRAVARSVNGFQFNATPIESMPLSVLPCTLLYADLGRIALEDDVSRAFIGVAAYDVGVIYTSAAYGSR